MTPEIETVLLSRVRALEAELSEVNAAVDASTEAGAEYATRELRGKLTEMAVAVSKVVDERDEAVAGECARAVERDEARAQVAALRDVLRAEIAMPHICSDCGWNVGGVPKGLHNFGCRVANAVDDPAEAAMAFVARVRSEAQVEQVEQDRAAVVRRFSGAPESFFGVTLELALTEHDAKVRSEVAVAWAGAVAKQERYASEAAIARDAENRRVHAESAARRDGQVDYSIALQRLIESLAAGRPLPDVKEKAPHLFDLAAKVAARIERLTTVVQLAGTLLVWCNERFDNDGNDWVTNAPGDLCDALEGAHAALADAKEGT